MKSNKSFSRIKKRQKRTSEKQTVQMKFEDHPCRELNVGRERGWHNIVDSPAAGWHNYDFSVDHAQWSGVRNQKFADYCKSLLRYTVDNACSFKKRNIVMWMITTHTQKNTKHSIHRQTDRKTYTDTHTLDLISPPQHTRIDVSTQTSDRQRSLPVRHACDNSSLHPLPLPFQRQERLGARMECVFPSVCGCVKSRLPSG